MPALREIALTILNAGILLVGVLVAVPVLAWSAYWCYMAVLSLAGAVSNLVGSTFREIDTKERKRRERSKLEANLNGVGSGVDLNLIERSLIAKRIRSLHRKVVSTAIQCWEAKLLVAMGSGAEYFEEIANYPVCAQLELKIGDLLEIGREELEQSGSVLESLEGTQMFISHDFLSRCCHQCPIRACRVDEAPPACPAVKALAKNPEGGSNDGSAQ